MSISFRIGMSYNKDIVKRCDKQPI